MMKLIQLLFSIIIIISFYLFPPKLTSETHADSFTMNVMSEPDPGYPLVFDISADDRVWIDSVLNNMTIREKVAQMIMPWAGGNYTPETSSDYQRIKYLVEDLKVGGLIFFKGDILNEALIINKFQGSAKVPLLISSDFERGLAMRLTDATEFPYNMALAAAGDLQLAKEMGRIIAIESRAIGIHQNYAPVADINDNADNPIINIRAYSEDKEIVSQYCKAFIEGSVQGRMISTVKHFPGHGNTATDSHQELPVINGTREELFNNELVPFIHAIKSGVHSVMIGHLKVPSLEPENFPATLSKNIITGLLKEELGFRGLIVTDAMNMNAVTRYFSAAQAAVLAVKAGNDILLMPPDEDIAITAITDAVFNGEIPVERINESVKKILSAKKWIGLDKARFTDIINLPSFVSSVNNNYFAHEIAERSITLVKNEENLIPLKANNIYSTGIISISDGIYTGDLFNELAEEEFGYIKNISLNNRSSDKDYKKALEIARTTDLVLLPSFIKVKAYQGTVKMSKKQTDFIKAVHRMNKPVIVISFGNPYLLSLFPESRTYLTSYGDAPVSQRAMLRAITGKADITGTLPISIPGTPFNRGDGIRVVHNALVTDAVRYTFPETESIIKSNLNDSIFPGAGLIISSNGKVIFSNNYGKTEFEDNSPLLNQDFLFDIDQVTSLYTTAAALILSTEGKLNLNLKVSDYVPGKTDKNLLIRDLLYKKDDQTDRSNLHSAASDGAGNKFILLQNVIENITGKTLDVVLNEKLAVPLNLKRTMFNPPGEYLYYSLPTIRHRRNKGVVYDDAAYSLKGIAGHAGIFTTAEDLSVFLQMIVQKGKYRDKQLIDETIFSIWYNDITEDLFISGRTGTAVWVNPSKMLSVVFLTNSSYTGHTDHLSSLLPEIYISINNSMKNWK